MDGSPLVGRDGEAHLLEAMFAGLGDRGGALVLVGGAGAGKSLLIADAVRGARGRGHRVLGATGVQTEADLAFSGLHQALRPLLAGADALPSPQRRALQAAFGESDAVVPDAFLIAMAVLSLLSDAAARQPLVVVIEDAHWMDRPSCEALAFVARRVESEPIALVVVLREGYESPFLDARLPALFLEPLGPDGAAELLDRTAPGLSPDLRSRVLAEAEGNPLALIELPRALVSSGGAVATLPLTVRLERVFAERSVELGPAAREVLLLAALDDGSSLAEVLAAAEVAGVADAGGGLELAVGARLLEVRGDEIRFRHPLVRSAIQSAAGVAERRAAHTALAEVLGAQPDRRAWHRAASVVGTDDAAAGELEAAAERAQRRGATVVSISALERAAAIGADGPARTRRLLAAAQQAFEAGRADLVSRLVGEIERRDLGPRERARAELIRESFTDGVPGDAIRVRELVATAREAGRGGDRDLALGLLQGAAWRCWWADPGEEARELVVATAEAIGAAETDPRLVQILGVASPVGRGAAVVARLDAAMDGPMDPEDARLLGFAAHTVGDFPRAVVLFEHAISSLRSRGRLALLAQALTAQAWNAAQLGDWEVTARTAEEGGRLARETGQPVWEAGAAIARALMLGLRGEDAPAGALLDEAQRTVLPHRLGNLLCLIQLTRGVTALSAGRYAEAQDHLRRMSDPADPGYHFRERFGGVGYLAEAAVHTGEAAPARAQLDDPDLRRLEGFSSTVRGAASYARAVLADGDEANDLFVAALADEPGSFHRARLQLAYGAFLRRARRPAESRAPLRAAREAFDALGLTAWGERARRELRASGERSRPASPALRDQLTPQELQIAELAAGGLSNREIGEALYLSHRTVGSHLYRMFPKLGITSRGQLVAALAPVEAGALNGTTTERSGD